MKCKTCKRARCVWVNVKDIKKATTEKLEEIVGHNLSYIDMVFSGHQGGSGSEERMYDQLEPYTREIERRKDAKL